MSLGYHLVKSRLFLGCKLHTWHGGKLAWIDGIGLRRLWQGVVVDVVDNKVLPRYTVHNRVFFSKWSDYPATAIQACERDTDGFSSNNSCIVSKQSSIAIPLDKSPYEYSYKFLFTRKNEAKSEETFILDKESLLEIKQRKLNSMEENSNRQSR